MADEDKIIEQILQGDVNAFRVLIERYQSMVFAVVGRVVPAADVEEVAHEVFIRAFKSLRSFRGDSPFRFWLTGIATRTAVQYWRSRSRTDRIMPESSLTSTEAGSVLETISSDHAVQDFLENDSAAGVAEVVQRALRTLSSDDQTLLSLLYFEDLPMREVAKVMKLSAANVAVRSFRAKQRLKRAVESLLSSEEVQ